MKSVLIVAASCSRAPAPIRAWSGEYWDGIYDAGTTLTIAPDGTFVCGSNGGVMWVEPDRAAGVVNLLDDGEFELEVREGAIDGLASARNRLHPVEWAGCHFLLRDEDLRRLANDINGYGEPHDSYWIRENVDEQHQPARQRDWSSRPKLPPEFEARVLKAPLVAHPRSIEPSTSPIVELAFDLGRADGAFVGMSMYAVEPLVNGELRISALDDRTSRGTWTAASSLAPAPTVEWTFSTRAATR